MLSLPLAVVDWRCAATCDRYCYLPSEHSRSDGGDAQAPSPYFSLALGGDHSITAMLIKGWKEAHPEERIGILQLDTHFDLRSLEDMGPSNGTPIRNLIKSGTIKGEDVYNIGLHGFFNAKSLKQYADEVGLNYVTLREARKHGLENVLQAALDELSQKVDTIYLTVDMDVLDIGVGPGAPAATPGGMRTEELFEAVYLAGECPKVRGDGYCLPGSPSGCSRSDNQSRCACDALISDRNDESRRGVAQLDRKFS